MDLLRYVDGGLLVGWTFAVVALTVLPLSLGNPNGEVNLVPGRGIADEWSDINRSLGMVNVFGNVVLFVPGGFLLAGLLRRRPWVAVLVLALHRLQSRSCSTSDAGSARLHTFTRQASAPTPE